MTKMAIKALVFDMFGTLVDWRSGISAAFRAANADQDPDALADGWRARYMPILAEVNDGARPWGNFDELHQATLHDLLGERGIELADEQRRRLIGAWHRLDPWPDVQTGLQALHQRHITAALSNGHVKLLIDLARHGDLRFDALLSAEMAHAYKPAPAVYRLAARLLDVQPGELMLVAAHPWDLEGARNAGLKTAFIDRPLEYGPGSPSRADPDADLTASDLGQLAAQLSPAR